MIGYDANGNGSDTITLGNSSIKQLRCQVTTITALSDKRVKEDIHEANLDMCLEAVRNLTVSRYKYKDFAGSHIDNHVTGFMADDVEKIFPKSVTKSDKYFPVFDEDGQQVYEEVSEIDKNGNETKRKIKKMFLLTDVKDITMTEAVPTLWGAVQALLQRVENLESKVKSN